MVDRKRNGSSGCCTQWFKRWAEGHIPVFLGFWTSARTQWKKLVCSGWDLRQFWYPKSASRFFSGSIYQVLIQKKSFCDLVFLGLQKWISPPICWSWVDCNVPAVRTWWVTSPRPWTRNPRCPPPRPLMWWPPRKRRPPGWSSALVDLGRYTRWSQWWPLLLGEMLVDAFEKNGRVQRVGSQNKKKWIKSDRIKPLGSASKDDFNQQSTSPEAIFSCLRWSFLEPPAEKVIFGRRGSVLMWYEYGSSMLNESLYIVFNAIYFTTQDIDKIEQLLSTVALKNTRVDVASYAFDSVAIRLVSQVIWNTTTRPASARAWSPRAARATPVWLLRCDLASIFWPKKDQPFFGVGHG